MVTSYTIVSKKQIRSLFVLERVCMYDAIHNRWYSYHVAQIHVYDQSNNLSLSAVRSGPNFRVFRDAPDFIFILICLVLITRILSVFFRVLCYWATNFTFVRYWIEE